MDAPYTDDLDLAAVATREELVTLLGIVYLRADRPSLRLLEARTRHGAVSLSKTVASEMLKGTRFPRKAVMLAFLQACGVQEDLLGAWQRAWERISVQDGEAARWPTGGPAQRHTQGSSGRAEAPSEEGTGTRLPLEIRAGADQMSDQMQRLRAENQQLRRQLAASRAKGAGTRPDHHSPPGGKEASKGSPVVSRRELGALLHALREEHGMTVEQVAAHLLCSAAKVSRMESGFRSGTVRDVRDLCSLYGLSEGRERDHLMDLAHESKQQGWWQQYNLPYGTYVGLETEAASISNYDTGVVPGLLQVEGYARAIYECSDPPLAPAVIEQHVEARVRRQALLEHDDGPLFHWILDEAALRRPVGGRPVMRVQLARIAEAASLPKVIFQLIPFDAGAHPGLDSNFAILTFNKPTVRDVIYVEGPVGNIYMEGAADLERYRRLFSRLQSIALDPEGSAAMVERIAATYEDG